MSQNEIDLQPNGEGWWSLDQTSIDIQLQEENIPEAVQEDFFSTDMERESKKELLVYKRNEIIHGRYKLSAFAQKTLASLIARINPRDPMLPVFEMTRSEFARMLGIGRQTAHRYVDTVTDELQEVVLRLPYRDRKWEAAIEEEKRLASAEKRPMNQILKPPVDKKSFDKVNLFHRSSYHYQSGLISFEFHPDMRDYLIDLKGNYTFYQLNHIKRMKSGYSIRLYELMRCALPLKQVRQGHLQTFKNFNYQELRETLGISADKYHKFYDFERFVLKQTQKDMEGGDLSFDYTLPERKKPRSTAKVKTIRVLIRAQSSALNVSNRTEEWQLNLHVYFTGREANRFLSEYPEEQIKRNVEYVMQQLAKGTEIKSMKGYMSEAIKSDYSAQSGPLNPSSYVDPRHKSFIKDRLLPLWDSALLTPQMKTDFLEKGLESAFISALLQAYLDEQKVQKAFSNSSRKAVTEAVMDVENTDW